MEIIFLIIFIAVVVGVIQAATMSPEEKNVQAWGNHNLAMICPHCQTKGTIHTQPVTQKKGLSGAKATGALLTGGLSVLATGLSKKETCTQAHCTNCNSTWFF